MSIQAVSTVAEALVQAIAWQETKKAEKRERLSEYERKMREAFADVVDVSGMAFDAENSVVSFTVTDEMYDDVTIWLHVKFSGKSAGILPVCPRCGEELWVFHEPLCSLTIGQAILEIFHHNQRGCNAGKSDESDDVASDYVLDTFIGRLDDDVDAITALKAIAFALYAMKKHGILCCNTC